MPELTSRRRLATFMARHSRSIFPITESFVSRLSRTFPAAPTLINLGPKTERFDFAQTVAALCKDVQHGSFDRAQIGPIAAKLRRAGFTSANAHAARSAFLSACREHAGLDWTPEIERDWADVADRFLNALGIQAAAAAPLRMAA